MQQAIREIFIGNFRKAGSPFRCGSLCGPRQPLYLSYDLGIGATLAPIYSLMFDLGHQGSASAQQKRGLLHHLEFSRCNLSHVDDAVNFGRSLGIKFLIGFQNIEQMVDIYGEARANSLLSGFLTQIFFRCNDPASRKYIQETFGTNRKKEVYMASVQGRGIVEQIRDAHVVEDWDISRLGLGQAIIGCPGPSRSGFSLPGPDPSRKKRLRGILYAMPVLW